MVIGNCSPPPRSRISSTERAPAMPLPTTTRRARVSTVVVQVQGGQTFDAAAEDGGHTSTRPRSTTSSPVTPSGAAACSSTTVPPVEVLDHPERHVHVALGADREVAHRLAVAHQQHVDQLVGGVAAAEVQRLGRPRRPAPCSCSAGSIGPGLSSPSPVNGKTPCRKRGLLFTRVLLVRDGLRGSGAVGCWWAAAGAGWPARVAAISSAGPSTRATATAQTLKAGILLSAGPAPGR